MHQSTTPNDPQRAAALSEVVARLIHDPSVQDSAKAFLKSMVSELRCDSGTFHRLDEDSFLRLIAHQGSFPPHVLLAIQEIPLGKGMAGVAAEKRHAVGACNLQVDTSAAIRPQAKDTQLKGTIAIPILVDDIVRGVVGLGNFSEREFTKEEIDTVSTVAALFFSKRCSMGLNQPLVHAPRHS